MNQSVHSCSGPRFVRGAPAALACAAILLIFAIPAQVLDLLGLGYGTPTGPVPGKIHPGTYLIALAIGIAALRAGNPFRYLIAQGRRFPGAIALLGGTVLLVIYLVKVQQAPFTPLIDTFVLPVLLFPLLVDLPSETRRLVERGLHVFLAFNAALGIVEFAAEWRLVPLSADGLAVTNEMEWRASGLLGHPLASASTAGTYAVILAMGCGRSLPGWARAPAIALQFISLAAFGGRTALVLTTGCFAVLAVIRAGALLRGRRFGRHSGALAILLLPFAIMCGLLLVKGGFFDQLLGRFVEDNGSARSRAVILHIFSYLTSHELWFGPDQEHLASILHLEGIEVGVESFWLAMILTCGIWMSFLFFAAFAFFVWEIMRRTDLRALVPLGFFIVVISTTLSLSTKTASLAQFMVMVMILMPAAPEGSRIAARAPRVRWSTA